MPKEATKIALCVLAALLLFSVYMDYHWFESKAVSHNVIILNDNTKVLEELNWQVQEMEKYVQANGKTMDMWLKFLTAFLGIVLGVTTYREIGRNKEIKQHVDEILALKKEVKQVADEATVQLNAVNAKVTKINEAVAHADKFINDIAQIQKTIKDYQDERVEDEEGEDKAENLNITDDRPSAIRQAILENNLYNLDEDRIGKIIQSLFKSKYSSRTIEGISKQAGLSRDIVRHTLNALKDRGMAESKTGVDGKNYWQVLKSPVKIIQALYGADGKFTDVTNQIKETLKSDGTYKGKAHHAFFYIPDPISGTAKTLTIKCLINGKEKTAVFGEGVIYQIPEPSV